MPSSLLSNQPPPPPPAIWKEHSWKSHPSIQPQNASHSNLTIEPTMSKPPASSVHLIICHLSVRVFNKKRKKKKKRCGLVWQMPLLWGQNSQQSCHRLRNGCDDCPPSPLTIFGAVSFARTTSAHTSPTSGPTFWGAIWHRDITTYRCLNLLTPPLKTDNCNKNVNHSGRCLNGASAGRSASRFTVLQSRTQTKS